LNAQFREDVIEMYFDGVGANGQFARDLIVGRAGGDQSQDLQFAVA
jgi:hypothetical protein